MGECIYIKAVSTYIVAFFLPTFLSINFRMHLCLRRDLHVLRIVLGYAIVKVSPFVRVGSVPSVRGNNRGSGDGQVLDVTKASRLLLTSSSRKLRKLRKLRLEFYASPVTVVEGLGTHVESPRYTAFLRLGG